MNNLSRPPVPDLQKKPIVIAVGGVSRSGKTFLAELLHRNLPDSVVINQDAYIPDEKDIPLIRDHIDWERPEAIDWTKFNNAIRKAGAVYKFVIAEGLFVFWNKETNAFFDKQIFITITKEEFLKRKKEDLRWGAEPDWYIEHIWQGHLKFGTLPPAILNPLIINGEEDFNLNKIITQLNLHW